MGYPFPKPFPGPTLFASVAFSPLALFAASEPGVWYDPSDLATMYQDSAGTTPVTAVEQPVGLRLDKSRGLVLGSELVTNGDFSDGLTGWTASVVGTATITAVDGKARVTTVDSSNYAILSRTITTVAGRWYRLTLTHERVSGQTTHYIVFGTNAGGWSSAATSFTFRAASSSTTFSIQTAGNAAGVFDVDNVSIRELPGSHAYQTTDINRPVLSARYNLLTYSETLTNAVWGSLGGTIASSVDVSPPSGVTSIFKLSEDSSTGRHLVGHVSAITVPAGALTVSAVVRKIDRRYVTINFVNSTGTGWFAALFDLDTGTYLDNNVASVGSTQTFVSGSISSLGDSWYRISVNGTTSATSGFVTVAHANAATYSGMTVAFGNPSFAGVSGNASYVSALDLRVSNDGVGLPAYQRVTTATDYDTTGFPLYLRYNGTNSTMQTAAIDFTSTAQMAVFAGVRKLSDAATGTFLETSTDAGANNGAFRIAAPAGASAATYDFVSRGTALAQTISTASFAAPISNVLAGLGDIANDTCIIRANGAQNNSASTNQGTGNYGNYPLYLGARGGSSLWFNGRDYGVCILGRTPTAAEITSMEAWMNGKTKAYA